MDLLGVMVCVSIPSVAVVGYWEKKLTGNFCACVLRVGSCDIWEQILEIIKYLLYARKTLNTSWKLSSPQQIAYT